MKFESEIMIFNKMRKAWRSVFTLAPQAGTTKIPFFRFKNLPAELQYILLLEARRKSSAAARRKSSAAHWLTNTAYTAMFLRGLRYVYVFYLLTSVGQMLGQEFDLEASVEPQVQGGKV